VASQATLPSVDDRFARILNDRDLRTMFQPIVRLGSGSVVGYEALVRGPDDPVLSGAEALIAAAHRAGRLVEFDWAARASACRAALDADLDAGSLLFLNIEPIALDTDCPPDLWPTIEFAFQRFRVVLEVTERSLDRDPGTLLDGVERQRPRVTGIALDDCGANPATLAMLPLVAPSVIKIDSGVVQSPPDARFACVLNAVHEQVERTGVSVLAEGVETAEHRSRAVALGAEFGQGYLFGPPGELPRGGPPDRESAPLVRPTPTWVSTPFEVLDGITVGHADDELLTVLMGEVGACADVATSVLHVALFPGGEFFGTAERERAARLAGKGAFAAVLGPGIPAEPGDGARGVGLRQAPLPDDEWAAITVGPCSTMAVLARRLPGGGEWEFGITHDRSRAIAATRCLVRLLGPPQPSYRYND
jgi:EAL domain-containing protein (putative c-di-GMP-specific phosphodiesterase class I)